MNFLVAPATFKDCLSADKVAELMKEAILQVLPSSIVKMIPLADGGEGTVDALAKALDLKIQTTRVHDPLMRSIEAKFGIIDQGNMAVIEMASASGIERLQAKERNPMITSTYGTGELIKAALDKGCRKIILGIGGSATNDAGVGALMALGVKFYDRIGQMLVNVGGDLSQIDRVDISGIDTRLSTTELLVACDVSNPMTGPEGASIIYSPQKGATREMAALLDRHLQHFAALIKKQFGNDIDNISGSGAAGGLGGGLLPFTKAKLVPGFEIIRQIKELDKQLQWADIIITGEGRIDSMTRFGKSPAGIAMLAQSYHKTVIGIAGSLGEDYEELYHYGFSAIYSIADRPITLEESIRKAPELIQNTVQKIVKTLKPGIDLRK
jgi:glycerate 2-kinase